MQKAAAYQRAAAKRLGKPVEITNSLGTKLKLIPAGKFMMAAPGWDKKAQNNERPEHLVRITEPYYLGVTEVTQSQWNAAMDSQPWKGDIYVKQGVDYPAAGMKWKDAVEFREKLSNREHMTYRLPTEAKWEYACRARTNTIYCFGNEASQLTRYAWWGISLFLGVDPYHPNESYPHRVAQKMPNAFGLYDMHGNVWEWCQGRYDSNYYARSPTDDPKGPRTGASRFFRGGSWIHGAETCRSANRSLPSPRGSYSWFGFRVAGPVVDVQSE